MSGEAPLPAIGQISRMAFCLLEANPAIPSLSSVIMMLHERHFHRTT
ncbi:Uncharacterised protein [Chlamydia abortus]|nr:Uncharacterised protein [Chlamydia abortus]